MEKEKRRTLIIQALKIRGLQLTREALKCVEAQTSSLPFTSDSDVQKWIIKVVDNVDKENLTSSFINEHVLTAALERARSSRSLASDARFIVLDAFALPRLVYQSDRRAFYLDTSPRTLHANADAKAAFVRERFLRVRQRVLRNKVFVPPVLANVAAENDVIQLTPIESLLGGTPGVKVVLGMLTVLPDGRHCLEDLNCIIPIVFVPDCKMLSGMFTDHCIVLCEGVVEDGVFHVRFLGMPPVEDKVASIQTFGNLDFFGAAPAPHEIERLRAAEIATETMLVMLSDVWLDDPKVMANLRTLFSGLNDACPVAFLFMGNFTSTPYAASQHGHQLLRGYFDALADLILQFPRLAQHSQFVFIPGSDDPGMGDCLPRPPLPHYFTRRLRQRVANAVLATNPCRVRYCTQEITLFREDLVAKMRRHCVLRPRSEGAGDGEAADGAEPRTEHMHEHLVKTVCDQGYLVPLPLMAQPVFWNHAQALEVYPLPDVLVLADRHDQYEHNYAGCRVYNPGSFPADSGFIVYLPHSRSAEFSRIDAAVVAQAMREGEQEAARRRKREKQRLVRERAAAISAASAEQLARQRTSPKRTPTRRARGPPIGPPSAADTAHAMDVVDEDGGDVGADAAHTETAGAGADSGAYHSRAETGGESDTDRADRPASPGLAVGRRLSGRAEDARSMTDGVGGSHGSGGSGRARAIAADASGAVGSGRQPAATSAGEKEDAENERDAAAAAAGAADVSAHANGDDGRDDDDDDDDRGLADDALSPTKRLAERRLRRVRSDSGDDGDGGGSVDRDSDDGLAGSAAAAARAAPMSSGRMLSQGEVSVRRALALVANVGAGGRRGKGSQATADDTELSLSQLTARQSTAQLDSEPLSDDDGGARRGRGSQRSGGGGAGGSGARPLGAADGSAPMDVVAAASPDADDDDDDAGGNAAGVGAMADADDDVQSQEDLIES